MTYTVLWEPTAIALASRFLADDPTGLREILTAVDLLAVKPRPAGAFPLGTTGLLRLRIGRYRVA